MKTKFKKAVLGGEVLLHNQILAVFPNTTKQEVWGWSFSYSGIPNVLYVIEHTPRLEVIAGMVLKLGRKAGHVTYLGLNLALGNRLVVAQITRPTPQILTLSLKPKP